MASPPFDINAALPGDSDIVSQHPFNARAFRDIVESWLLVNHNNLGQHDHIDMPFGGSAGTPAASTAIIYLDINGNPRLKTASVDQYLGVPPGTIVWDTNSAPNAGYLIADGSAVSRTVFATLFSRIGTFYGSGNGSTTFNLPNLTGRVPVGVDSNQFVITGWTSVGLRSGAQNVALSRDHMAPVTYTPTGTIFVNDPSHRHDELGGVQTPVSDGVGGQGYIPQFRSSSFNFTGITASFAGDNVNVGGSSLPFSIMQPGFALLPTIKY